MATNAQSGRARPESAVPPARNPRILGRRNFLKQSLAATVAMVLGVAPSARGATQRYRAAVIGHTGRGNYGHGLDVLFNDHEQIEVVAVADPDPAGRAQAMARCRAPRQYASYQELLTQEKPDLVSIAPRWTDQHYAIGRAALSAGAHLFMEKPFTQTLKEADELLKLARQKGRQIAVAHQMRLAPVLQELKTAITQGQLGELLEIRAHGKQDSRAGAEDMIVLGTHLFDLMRLFAGDAEWCSARVLENGRRIQPSDAHPASENIGPIAGNEIFAHFAFEQGVNGTFTSRAKNRQAAGHWGLLLIGTRARARILADIVPRVYLQPSGNWEGTVVEKPWEQFTVKTAVAVGDSGNQANRRLVDDWLSAIAEKRTPQCSGHGAMKALEMIMAVFGAGLTGSPVKLPLVQREHPLAAP